MIRFIFCALLFIAAPSLAHAQAVLSNAPTAGTQATVSTTAAPGIMYHACAIVASIVAGSGGASGSQTLNLRDGGTGAGTVLFSVALGSPSSNTAGVVLDGIDIVGTPGNAMTLEFASGGANSANESVTLIYRSGQPGGPSCLNPPS